MFNTLYASLLGVEDLWLLWLLLCGEVRAQGLLHLRWHLIHLQQVLWLCLLKLLLRVLINGVVIVLKHKLSVTINILITASNVLLVSIFVLLVLLVLSRIDEALSRGLLIITDTI